MGKPSLSVKRVGGGGGSGGWRSNTTSRRMYTTFALNKASKALSSVSVENLGVQRGNIKVVVRVRPQNQRESVVAQRNVIHVIDQNMVLFDPPDQDTEDFYYKGVRQNTQAGSKRHKNLKLAFDNVYGPASTNEEIYKDVIPPLLDNLVSGYNCSVFAYGATGSGKTYTMIGSKQVPGLTFKTLMDLYERLEQLKDEYEAEIHVSYCEVYNETVRDLLVENSPVLDVREDATSGVNIVGQTTYKPKDAEELMEILAQGNSRRSQHPTDHNAESSRSHAVFIVHLTLRHRFQDLTTKYKSGKLVMVDLAGSEKGSATGFQGQRFREGASINRSLLSLGNCINALADGKGHIPYRDSKLTRILKDSLGGNCKTVMIANVSPSTSSFDDTYNTLRYADRAKKIKVQVKKNAMSVSACLTQYTKVVEEMGFKIEKLEKELNEYRAKCNVPKADAETETDMIESPPPLERTVTYDKCDATFAIAPPTPSPSSPESSEDGKVKEDSAIINGNLERIRDLTVKRITITKALCEASISASSAGTKMGIKERRISTIKRLKPVNAKNISKISKQIEPLKARRSHALKKRKEATLLLDSVNKEMIPYEKMFGDKMVWDTPTVTLPASEFIRLQNLAVENERLSRLKSHYKSLSNMCLDEVQKTEHMLGDAVEFLSSQHLVSKHYKTATKQMETEYEDFVSNLCGTKVQWSKDDDVSISMPPLKKFLNDSIDEESEATGQSSSETFISSEGSRTPSPLRTKHENSMRPPLKRPPTPPRLPGISIPTLDDFMNASDISGMDMDQEQTQPSPNDSLMMGIGGAGDFSQRGTFPSATPLDETYIKKY